MINCEHPNIIINPSVYQHIQKNHIIYLNDHPRNFLTAGLLNVKYLYCVLSEIRKSLNIKTSDFNLHYFVDDFGIRQLVFLQVPCNHCNLCRRRRQNDLVQRFRFETEEHSELPYFVTLTHNRYSLPKDNLVHIRTIQLYIKRLRDYALRDFGITDISFYAQGEYGKKRNRPHYHFLIWGLPKFDNILVARDWFSKSWRTKTKISFYQRSTGKIIKSKAPLGIVHCSQVASPDYLDYYFRTRGKRISATDAFKYASKYSTKDGGLSTWSCHLGEKYVKRTYSADLLGLNPRIDIYFLDRFGTTSPVIKNRWFFNVVFGNLSKETYKLRSELKHIVASLSVKNRKLVDWCTYKIKPIADDYGYIVGYPYINKREVIDYLKNKCVVSRLKRVKSRFNQFYYYNGIIVNNLLNLYWDTDFDELENRHLAKVIYQQRCFAVVPELTVEEVAINSHRSARYAYYQDINQSL